MSFPLYWPMEQGQSSAGRVRPRNIARVVTFLVANIAYHLLQPFSEKTGSSGRFSVNGEIFQTRTLLKLPAGGIFGIRCTGVLQLLALMLTHKA